MWLRARVINGASVDTAREAEISWKSRNIFSEWRCLLKWVSVPCY